MSAKVGGIHHVTAIAGDPQANVDFYTGVLGLRLVKVTVNYDDPHTYHLYYGDGLGRPGTTLSPRGNVLENGMPRYFRRLAEGVFDLADLRARTHELADFVAVAVRRYRLAPDRVIAVGFSNGANIAASVLLLRPEVLAGGRSRCIGSRPRTGSPQETSPQRAPGWRSGAPLLCRLDAYGENGERIGLRRMAV